jgi:hypothetical protein
MDTRTKLPIWLALKIGLPGCQGETRHNCGTREDGQLRARHQHRDLLALRRLGRHGL